MFPMSNAGSYNWRYESIFLLNINPYIIPILFLLHFVGLATF